MDAPSSPCGADQADKSAIRIGALIPLTRPGWVEAGRHLLAGLELAVRDVNEAGGITGRPLELVTRDTAADPQRAAQAVDELSGLGVAQSHGWPVYADFLLRAGHTRIAAATQPSMYWESGTRILRDYLAPRGGTVTGYGTGTLTPAALCDELAATGATALLLLVGSPEPAAPIVQAVRGDQRLAGVMIGAPAGQPEFAEWLELLGADGAAIPFLRYLPEDLTPLGTRAETALRERLGVAPSFVAFGGSPGGPHPPAAQRGTHGHLSGLVRRPLPAGAVRRRSAPSSVTG